MKLEITKEKVLEAASKCSTAKATLQTLFPEAFDDGIAIKAGVFDSGYDDDLRSFCQKAFGDSRAVQITAGAALEESQKFRSLYIHGDYTVETVPSGIGTIIVIKKKK